MSASESYIYIYSQIFKMLLTSLSNDQNLICDFISSV